MNGARAAELRIVLLGEVVAKNPAVVKGDSFGQRARGVDASPTGIARGLDPASTTSREDHGRGMPSRVPVRLRIDVKLFEIRQGQTGFFPGFTPGCLFNTLAVINKTSGQRPARRRVFPFNQNDATSVLNDHVDGQSGAAPTSLTRTSFVPS